MKKIIALLLASVMVLGLFAGCGSSKPAETTPPAAEKPAEAPAAEAPAEAKKYEGVTLNYWSMWNAEEPQGQVLLEAIAAFEEETGATVKVEWKGRELNQVIMASLEAGEKIDLFDEDFQRIALQYVDYTADLTDMASAAGYVGYPSINNQVIGWAGHLNSICMQPQAGGVFYIKDAFETAGITAEPQTWAEFLDVCQKLKDAGIAPQALDSAYSYFTFYYHLNRFLGEAAIKELALNGGWGASEGAVKAAQTVIDFVKAGYLVDGAPDEYPSSQNKLGTGEAAMVVCGNYVTGEIDNIFGPQNWGMFNYPAVEGGVNDGTGFVGANSFAVTSYSENQQAAFDFIMSVVTGEMDKRMVEVAGHTPSDPANVTEATAGAVAALSAESNMTWCEGTNANSDLVTNFKSLFNEIYEGKYETGEAFCAALDALY